MSDTERSLAHLLRDIRNDSRGLVQDEAALAKAELTKGATKLGIGGALLVVAGVFGFLALIILLFAASAGLHAAGLPWWASFLIVAGVLLVLAAILALVGIPQLKKANLNPEKAIAGAKSALGAVRAAAKNPSGPRF
jgi:hypothetical protein